MDLNHSSGNILEPVLPPFTKPCEFLPPKLPDAEKSDAESRTTLPDGYVELPGKTILMDAELTEHLTRELDVSRLNKIHDYLWVAGSRSNIRALHEQKIKQRLIIVTERADLHLVWWGSMILIKPLPPFLCSYDFFLENLCSSRIPDGQISTLYASACRLLYTYMHLISHESDLKIAIDHGLLPAKTTWQQWSLFASCMKNNLKKSSLNKRYVYGELRRTRLNLVYRIICHEWRTGYYYVYTEYQTLFGQYFAGLLLAFAYVSVVLSAMQVGLGTQFGQSQYSFERASYGFAVTTLVAVVVVVGVLCLLFIGIFLDNLMFAWGKKRSRLSRGQV
ncbi:hypothetical protein K440DRAFT_654398 [Wilcoxina mikolae CBS 423.85]|nr:hypothetical protein K440DRAFT_654398 [Wilcoxina mikolae CBS 423.85]